MLGSILESVGGAVDAAGQPDALGGSERIDPVDADRRGSGEGDAFGGLRGLDTAQPDRGTGVAGRGQGLGEAVSGLLPVRAAVEVQQFDVHLHPSRSHSFSVAGTVSERRSSNTVSRQMPSSRPMRSRTPTVRKPAEWCSARLARFSGKIEVCSVHNPA